MRFNEKELVFLSRQPSERAAELGMKGPKKGDGKIMGSHTCPADLVSSVIILHWTSAFTPAFVCVCVFVCLFLRLFLSNPLVMKRRLVKLIVNFLFYFRTYEEEVRF